MSEVEVAFDAITRAAAEHDGQADRTRRIEGDRAAASLPPGSLGRLPQSDDIQAAFDARYDGAGAALSALEEIFTNISDGLRATARAYADTDESVHAAFRRLGGGR